MILQPDRNRHWRAHPSRSISGCSWSGGPAFTIVEVVMAVALLAFAISTSITTLQRAFLNLDTARNLSTAATLLQTEMEKERLLDWATVSNTSYQPTLDPNHLSNPLIASRFTLSRSAVPLTGTSGKMVQVTLRVTWRNYDGRQLSRSFTTYFTQGGLNEFIITL